MKLRVEIEGLMADTEALPPAVHDPRVYCVYDVERYTFFPQESATELKVREKGGWGG